MIKILKKGLIFNVNQKVEWQKTHAMIPTPFKVSENIYKIYYGSRNSINQSHIGYFNFDTVTNEVCASNELVLAPGELGCFDDNGVLPSCCIDFQGERLLYYIGFKPGGTTRMDLYGGLAIYDFDQCQFRRWSQAPIIERNIVNPLINTAPFVVEWNNMLLMYYVAGIEWVNKDLPRYNIQIATSLDGKNWERNGDIAIDFLDGENALARPFVYKYKNVLRMLFSAKGTSYKICAAESKDGMNWTRIQVDIEQPNFDNLDNEMNCYPVLLGPNMDVLLYNGNGYGKSGILIGLASQ